MLEALIFALFGLVVGSFLNVAILRHGEERSLGGRSSCMSCYRQLLWYDMVPVVSWLMLKGRCRFCRARISIQYPIVEALTGIFFALVGGAPIELSLQVLALPCLALLLMIAVYDLQHTIIPDEWSYALAALAFLFALDAYASGAFLHSPTNLALFLLAGPAAAAPFFLLWLVSRGAWMGLGDAKLALGMGWLVGLPLAYLAILVSFVAGAVISVGILLPLPFYMRLVARFTPTPISKKVVSGFTMRSEVAFGPFLVLGTLAVFFPMIWGLSIPFLP